MPLHKRTFDVVFSLIAIALLSPILLLTSLIVFLFIGKPVLFKQQRPGFNGTPFFIYKFRTMIDQSDPNGQPLSDAERLTQVGRFLRALSLDELPELFNILKGEMSFVGPRPLLMEYLPLYSPEQARRHEVVPGLTGWAQINGRNAIDWETRFQLDIWYINNWSFWLDIKIIALTFWKTLTREGVNQKGQATVEAFQGNRKTAK